MLTEKHFINKNLLRRLSSGYGDSTNADLSEEAVVSDLTQFYKWIRNKTSARIFIWGHSLGTAIGTRTVAALREQNIIPTGLILEAPFTTMREELPLHPVGRVCTLFVL